MNPHAVYLEVDANNSNNDDDNEVFQNLLSMKKVSFNKRTRSLFCRKTILET